MRPILIGTVLLPTVTGAHARGGGGQGLSGTGSSGASHRVSGYTTSRGTIVAPSHATDPNGTARDKFDTRGTVNLYTGIVGARGAER